MNAETRYIDGYEVLTPSGFRPFMGVQKLRKWVYYVKTENHEMECSYDHPFHVNDKIIKYSELKVGDILDTKSGVERVIELKPTGREEDVYDLLEVEDGHVFYSDGIISHNCQFIETGESAVAGDILDQWRKVRKPPMMELDDGHYLVWEMPNSSHMYSIGVDTSEGVGEAASVIQVLDITDLTNIRQVACYHDRLIDPNLFAKKIFMVANQWGQPFLAIERNNSGAQVIDSLYNTYGYSKFINYTTAKGAQDRFGIYSHRNTKYTGVSNMRYWINTLRVVEVNDISLIQEFETFIRFPNGVWKKKSSNNVYDDRVDAFFWALLPLDEKVCDQYFEVISYDNNGKPAKLKNVFIEPSPYYKLGEFYQKNPKAPPPLFFGFNPTDVEEDGMADLMNKGWIPLMRD